MSTALLRSCSPRLQASLHLPSQRPRGRAARPARAAVSGGGGGVHGPTEGGEQGEIEKNPGPFAAPSIAGEMITTTNVLFGAVTQSSNVPITKEIISFEFDKYRSDADIEYNRLIAKYGIDVGLATTVNFSNLQLGEGPAPTGEPVALTEEAAATPPASAASLTISDQIIERNRARADAELEAAEIVAMRAEAAFVEAVAHSEAERQALLQAEYNRQVQSDLETIAAQRKRKEDLPTALSYTFAPSTRLQEVPDSGEADEAVAEAGQPTSGGSSDGRNQAASAPIAASAAVRHASSSTTPPAQTVSDSVHIEEPQQPPQRKWKRRKNRDAAKKKGASGVAI